MFEEIIVMSAKPTPKAAKHIAQRIAKKQCLCCEKPLLKRGLCHQCYYRWMTRRRDLPTGAKRAAYDAKLIRCGRLLASGAVRRVKDNSVFAQAQREVG